MICSLPDKHALAQKAMKAFTMWTQAEGVSRPSQRTIAPGGSLRLAATESSLAKVVQWAIAKCWEWTSLRPWNRSQPSIS